MPRVYQVLFEGVTVSAAQDLCQLTGATGKMFEVLEVSVGCPDTVIATGQDLSLRCRFLPATVTVGSAGTTGVTPSKIDPGDAACSSATCATNNTVKATSSGTAVKLLEGACHLYQGFHYRFPENERPVVGPSEAFVFELLSTVSGTVTLSGFCKFREFGG